MMKTIPKPSKRFFLVLILGVAVLVALVLISDWREMGRVLEETNWQTLPEALLFTTISYVCLGYSFAKVSRLLGIRMREGELAEVGFISVILNHMLTMGGVFGYAVRYLFMNRHGVPFRDIVAVSILHFYISSLVILAMVPVSFIYLLLFTAIPQATAILLGLLTALLVAVTILGTLVIFSNRLRWGVLNLLSRGAQFFLRRDVSTTFRNFDDTMARSVAEIRGNPALVVWITLLVVVEWITAVVTLHYCFLAFGVSLSPGELMTGTVIGLVAGVISMVPGGIGTQEGSMAGIFALMGVPFEVSVLASILFRGVYYILPFLVSFGFYWKLLRSGGQSRPYPAGQLVGQPGQEDPRS